MISLLRFFLILLFVAKRDFSYIFVIHTLIIQLYGIYNLTSIPNDVLEKRSWQSYSRWIAVSF